MKTTFSLAGLLSMFLLLTAHLTVAFAVDPSHDHVLVNQPPLERRRGGGGRGSGSGSGSGSGGTGRTGTGTGTSGTGSNTGGRTTGGSGTRPGYASGAGPVYGGGAAVPYTAGRASPLGVTPFLLAGGALGVFAAFHFASAGAYRYNLDPVTFYNQTSKMNETLPVDCLCARYAECSCDRNTDSAYVQSVIGNGSYATQQAPGSVYHVVQDSGRTTLAIDGTLANGTTAADATTAGSAVMMQSAGWLAVLAATGVALLSV